ncbi:MAG: hypothetical protein RLW42_05230, partial [Gammaproteobacteria bacterium]
ASAPAAMKGVSFTAMPPRNESLCKLVSRVVLAEAFVLSMRVHRRAGRGRARHAARQPGSAGGDSAVTGRG